MTIHIVIIIMMSIIVITKNKIKKVATIIATFIVILIVIFVDKVTNVEPIDSNILPNKSLYANLVSLIKQSTQEYYNMRLALGMEVA